MKKHLLFLWLAVACASSLGHAQSTTTHYGLYKPADHEKNYGSAVNGNFDIIDNHLYTLSLTTGLPGGTGGQIQYSNGGAFGGFTMSGDCTINTSTGAVTCTKTNGVAFAASATTNTTNAANISSGTLPGARFPSSSIIGQFSGCSGVLYLGADGACHSASAVGSTVFNVTTYGADPTGVANSTTAFNNALAAAYAAGGGTVYFPAGTFLIAGQIDIPNDGGTAYEGGPLQPSIRITGASSDSAMLPVGYPTPIAWGGTLAGGGSILNMTFNSTTAKIATFGGGKLELDHLTLADNSTDAATFFFTGTTTVFIHDVTFVGTTAATVSMPINDAILLGNNTMADNDGFISTFQGYGSTITRNFFQKIKRAVIGHTQVNSVNITENTVWSNSGNNGGGAIVIGDSTGPGIGSSQDNLIEGNLFELSYYTNGIQIISGNGNQIIGNQGYDAQLGAVVFDSLVKFETGANYNMVIGGNYQGTQNVHDLNGTNTVLANVLGSTLTLPQGASPSGLILSNPTTATVSTTNSSSTLQFAPQYWTGSASAADTWTAQSSLTAGSGAPSTLAFTHTGSTGQARVSVPKLVVFDGVVGDAPQAIIGGAVANINSNVVLTVATNNTPAIGLVDTQASGHAFWLHPSAGGVGNLGIYDQTAAAYKFVLTSAGVANAPFGMNVGSGTVFGVGAASSGVVTPDTGLSRDSAGVWDVGNGSAANKSGTMNMTHLALLGSLKLSRAPITNADSPYTVLATDTVITCNAGSGAVTINLPAALGTGRYLAVQKSDATANACTLTRASSDLINGATTYALTSQFAAVSTVDSGNAVWSNIQGGGGAATLATGTSTTLIAPKQYYVCTGTCTVTPPVPAAGYEFCVLNTDNVATVITMAAIGSSARYEATARTSYGSAGTGTFISGGAAGDKVCLLGLDSTHYLTTSFTGTWTAN